MFFGYNIKKYEKYKLNLNILNVNNLIFKDDNTIDTEGCEASTKKKNLIKEYVNYNADKKDTSLFTLSRIDQIKKMNGILRVNNDVEMIFILNVRNHWIVITNFCRSLDIYTNEQEFYIYDSFNDDMYATHDIVKDFIKFLNRETEKFSVKVNKMQMHTTQEGLNDCGLFAIAYAYLLLINEEPAICSIDQYSMRRLYNRFVTKDLLYMMFGYEQVDKQITGKSYKTFEIFLN